MRRGSLAHALLEKTLGAAQGAHGLGGDHAGAPRRRARGAARHARRGPAAPAARPPAASALLRGLEADLERYLRTEAEAGAGYEPDVLEWSFGTERDAHPPLPLGDGETLVTGRVDRVDAGPGRRRDRPRLQGPDGHRRHEVGGARAAPGRALPARRARAARAGAGGRPLPAARGPQARRARARARGHARRLHAHRPRRRRRRSRPRWTAARELAQRTAAELHAGRIAPCPERCSSRGCRHPAICRAGEPKVVPPA